MYKMWRKNSNRMIRVYVWNSTIYKAKTYFYTKLICACLLYAISIYYIYVLYVSESCVVCICIYSCSKHDMCIYVLLYACSLCLCYEWLLFLIFYSCYIFLLRKTGTSVIVQVRSDAGWVTVRYRNLNMTNNLYDPNCLWVLVGWPWPGARQPRVGPCWPIPR